MSSVKELNIILLGEIGVGKSLFINSFANYSQYGSLEEAIQSKNPTTLISSTYTITDSNNEDRVIEAGENDGIERSKIIIKETFPIYKCARGDVIVRLIDTPGIGSGDDEVADGNNVANILSFIKNFNNLHAIAIILKNTASKMTDKLSDCLKNLILNKTTAVKVVFILTNSKNNDFKPGPIKEVIIDLLPCIVKELTSSKIILDRKNMYCVDNKSYEYLIATHRSVQFNERDLDIQSSNWRFSSEEMTLLIKYISQLNPFTVMESATNTCVVKESSILNFLESGKKLSSAKEFNIILLGEAGTGKSSFVNSFANYCRYKNLAEAIASKKVMSLISSTFTITDSKDEDHLITAEENDFNEQTPIGKSYTIKVVDNCYKFQFGNLIVKLIDTPSVGASLNNDDERADEKNIANILDYVNNFDNLHAIGIVMKNSETKMTDVFKDFLKLLLTKLNKTAVSKIVFLLTFCNGFKPGPVKQVLKSFLDNEFKNNNTYSKLTLDKNIMYCFDNACYEYLIAVNRNVKFDEREFNILNYIWKYSSREINRLVTYINQHVSSVKDFNLILLGETGIGKSLFINSFANYSQYNNFNDALTSRKPLTLIPSKLNITDMYDKDHLIEAGENDGNERTKIGESFTIKCNSYKFQFGDVIVRLIDTPGMGDTKGEQADKENLANILSFINNFVNLHAIAILMKNTETKMTARFSDCLKTLLTNLNKTAVKNIVFVLTFSKGNDFEPGPVKDVLKLFIGNELRDSTLTLNKNIMYCIDNKCYDYLIAANQGVQFQRKIMDSQNISWQCSSEEMTRLMRYIRQLTPHSVKDSLSLNHARNLIKVINPFLLEVLENIESNTNLINKFQADLLSNERGAKTNRILKLENIKIVPIDKAITFCTSSKCREVIYIGDAQKYHYPQHCCKGCTVTDLLSWWCQSMDFFGNCKVCECSRSQHNRKFYKTEKTSSDWFTDEAAVGKRKTVDAERQWEMEIESLKKMKDDLLLEKKQMEIAEKMFTKFLQTHTLVKADANDASVRVIEKCDEEIEMMECISIEEFYQLKSTLTGLPISGKKIEAILEANEKELNNLSFFDKATTILNKNLFNK